MLHWHKQFTSEAIVIAIDDLLYLYIYIYTQLQPTYFQLDDHIYNDLGGVARSRFHEPIRTKRTHKCKTWWAGTQSEPTMLHIYNWHYHKMWWAKKKTCSPVSHHKWYISAPWRATGCRTVHTNFGMQIKTSLVSRTLTTSYTSAPPPLKRGQLWPSTLQVFVLC